jgi:hypothetical protein
MSNLSKGNPLSARQSAFACELGIELAEGRRNFTAAYIRAGYTAGPAARGNAARLARDPRIWEVVDKVAREAVRLSGVHLAYLQAKALQLLETNVLDVHRRVAESMEYDPESEMVRPRDLTAEQKAELYAATWAMSEVRTSDGLIAVKIPDKRGTLELLLKTIPGALAAAKTPDDDPMAKGLAGLGARLAAATKRVEEEAA